MITKKTIKVPIYNYKITIVVADNIEDTYTTYPDVIKDADGCVLEATGQAILIVTPKSPSVWVHECTHLKNCIWEYIDYKPQTDNDEVDAYLMGYLFDEILKVIDKHKKDTAK